MARQGTDRFTQTIGFARAVDREASARGPELAAVGGTVDPRVLELLIARLCHELSAPIAAINNGIELLAEEDPGCLNDAMALVGDSARRAGSSLQFYRFAYGFARGGKSAGPTPHELAVRFFDAGRITCDYPDSVQTLSPDSQKLACNLLLVGTETLPRGGRLLLTDDPLSLEAIGEAAVLTSERHAALSLTTPIAELTPRTIQAFFTGLLARALGCRVIGTQEPGRVRLTVASTGT